MSILIGHASISEKGTVNGTKGDQTGKEVCTCTWDSKPWDYMAIYPDATVREKIAAAVEAGCANNNIGYGQSDRNTLNTLAKAVGYDLSKVTTTCNTDCSAFMNVACVAAGVGSYGSNGWTTYTMKTALQNAGFKIVTNSTMLKSSAYCVRGAIYVEASSHTVCGLTNGANYAQTLAAAGASSSSTTTTTTTSSSSSVAGTYKVTASSGLNIRKTAGTSGAKVVAIPKNTQVTCDGTYETVSGVKWLYVTFTYGGKNYNGYGISTYLSKV